MSKIKNLLGKAAVRSKEALVEAIGQALWAVTAEDALGYLEHSAVGEIEKVDAGESGATLYLPR